MNFNITKLNQDISKKDLQILKLKDDLDEQKLKLSAFTSEEQFETISIEQSRPFLALSKAFDMD